MKNLDYLEPRLLKVHPINIDNAFNALKQEEAVTWEQAHNILSLLVYQARLFLREESQQRNTVFSSLLERPFLKRDFITSLVVTTLGKNLGLEIEFHETKRQKTHFKDSFISADNPDRYFSVVHFPIKLENGSVKKHAFIVDVTYNQFTQKCVNSYEDWKVKFAINSDKTKNKVARQLLRYGFLYAGKASNHHYLSLFNHNACESTLSQRPLPKEPEIRAFTVDYISALEKLELKKPSDIYKVKIG